MAPAIDHAADLDVHEHACSVRSRARVFPRSRRHEHGDDGRGPGAGQDSIPCRSRPNTPASPSTPSGASVRAGTRGPQLRRLFLLRTRQGDRRTVAVQRRRLFQDRYQASGVTTAVRSPVRSAGWRPCSGAGSVGHRRVARRVSHRGRTSTSGIHGDGDGENEHGREPSLNPRCWEPSPQMTPGRCQPMGSRSMASSLAANAS
jgi:hypothetical protein